MSQNILQIFTNNPASSMVSTDLLYLGRSPYDTSDDFAITFANFVASIGTATPTASTIPRWDANINLSASGYIPGFATTATAAGTTTLVVGSKQIQEFTGVTTQTVVMPDVTTLVAGKGFQIINNSSGVVTVNSSGSNLIQAMASGTSLYLTCVLNTGTTAASWESAYIVDSGLAGAVLLSPSGDQTITSGKLIIANGNLISLNGTIVAGSSAGQADSSLYLFSQTANLGSLIVRAANNAGVFNNILTNASTSAARTWTLPDETGTFALTGDLTGFATQAQVQSSAFNYGVDTGTADAYIVDLTPAITSLTDGLLLSFSANNANLTNSPTLTVNGQVANIVTLVGTALSPNDLGLSTSLLMYSVNNGAWLLMNPAVSVATAGGIQNAEYIEATDSGVANAYIATFGAGGGNFSAGFGSVVSFQPAHSNTAASTLAIGGGSPTVIITQNGDPLAAGALLSTKTAYLMFGINNAGTLGWILTNPQGVYIPTSKTAGFQPVAVSGTSQALAAGGAYVFNNAAATTGTLPTSANSSIGDTIKVKGRSSAHWVIQANTGQIITNGAAQSTTAGTATSALR